MLDDILQQLKRAMSTSRLLDVLEQLVKEHADAAYAILEEQLKNSNDVTVQTRAIQLIAELPPEMIPSEAEDLLIHYLVEPYHWDIRTAVTDTLAHLATPGTVEKLAGYLADSDWDLVAHIVQLLGKSALPEALPLIMKQADHTNPFVRRSAAQALTAYPMTEKLEALLLRMLEDENEYVVLHAAQSLKNSRSKTVFQKMKKIEEEIEHEEAKEALLEATSSIHLHVNELLDDPSLSPIDKIHLMGEWADEKPELQAHLEQELQHISEQFQHYSEEEQQTLATALLQVKSKQARSAQDMMVRKMLQVSPKQLANMVGEQVVPHILLDVAKSVTSNRKERQEALGLLTQKITSLPLSKMLFLLEESADIYRAGKLAFLSKPDMTLDVFSSYLKKQPSASARQRIQEILQEIKDPRGIPLLVNLLQTTEQEEEQEAIKESILTHGLIAADYLLQSLSKTADIAIKRDILDILLALPPYSQGTEIFFKLLSGHDPEILERIQKLLTRLDTDNRQLATIILESAQPNEKRDICRHILYQREDASLLEMVSIFPDFDVKQRQELGELLVEMIQQRPDRTSRFLVSLLKHQKDAIRMEAIDMIARLDDREAVEEMVQLLKSGNPDIQKMVLNILPSWQGSAIPYLLTLLEKEVGLRTLLIQALCRMPSEQLAIWLTPEQPTIVQEALIESLGNEREQSSGLAILPYLQSTVPSTQLAALHALRRLKSDVKGEAIFPLLQHENLDIRVAAIEICSDLQLEESLALIIPNLDSHQRPLQMAAIYAIGKLKALEQLEKLLAFLKQANQADDKVLKKQCIQALGDLSAPSALPPLQEMLTNEKDETLILQLLEAMAYIRIPETVSVMQQYFETQESQNLRCHTIRILGSMHLSEAYTFLIERLPELTVPLQREILHALGNASEIWILPTLLNYLKHENWRIQRSAIEALGHFAHMDALNPLKSYLKTIQDNQYVWGWILRSAVWDAVEKIREGKLMEI